MDSLFLSSHFLFLQLARDVGSGLLSSDVLDVNKKMDAIWASLEGRVVGGKLAAEQQVMG